MINCPLCEMEKTKEHWKELYAEQKISNFQSNIGMIVTMAIARGFNLTVFPKFPYRNNEKPGLMIQVFTQQGKVARWPDIEMLEMDPVEAVMAWAIHNLMDPLKEMMRPIRCQDLAPRRWCSGLNRIPGKWEPTTSNLPVPYKYAPREKAPPYEWEDTGKKGVIDPQMENYQIHIMSVPPKPNTNISLQSHIDSKKL